MKIINFLLVISILIGLTVSFNSENSVESVSAAEGQINLNSGIFNSISKYKLKNKSKSKSKNKVSKAKSATTVKTNTGEEASIKALSKSAQAVAAAPLPAQGVNILSGVQPSSKGNTNASLKAGPKLWEGWVKFYIYKSTDDKSLMKGTIESTKFFKNYQYYEQFKKDPNLNVEEVIDKQYKYIHDPYSFFVTLFPNNINFSNSRIVSSKIIF